MKILLIAFLFITSFKETKSIIYYHHPYNYSTHSRMSYQSYFMMQYFLSEQNKKNTSIIYNDEKLLKKIIKKNKEKYILIKFYNDYSTLSEKLSELETKQNAIILCIEIVPLDNECKAFVIYYIKEKNKNNKKIDWLKLFKKEKI